MDALDKIIINNLQEGFPVCERPFAELADKLDVEEDSLIKRIQSLLDNGTLSRFGPLYNIEKLGGVYCLVAMSITEQDLEYVIGVINSYPEVAHNYERDHDFNVWFVVAVENKLQLETLLGEIEDKSGYLVYKMPKLKEFYVGLKFVA
jgi:siroheme decarboxylase